MFNNRNIRLLSILIWIIATSACQRLPVSDPTWKKVAEGFAFPEGPAWDARGSLYLSDCYGQWVARLHDGTCDTLAQAADNTFAKTNGLALSSDGKTLYACDYGRGAIITIDPKGLVKTLLDGYQGQRFNRPNDINLNGNNLYFTDPKGYGTDVLDGRLFCYDLLTNQLDLTIDSLAFPNGLAVSPLDNMLYVCESGRQRIIRIERKAAGSPGQREEFIVLPGGDPDGIEFDNQGNLFAAHFGGGNIYVITPSGKILQTIPTPGKKPTNLEFGGPDGRTLFLTEVETQAVYKIKTRWPGAR